MKWRCKNWPEGMLLVSFVTGLNTLKLSPCPQEKQVIVFITFPIFLPEHYATVALNFVPTPGQTELQLDCKGVPACNEENMKFCWKQQHFEEIKGLLQLTTLNG